MLHADLFDYFTCLYGVVSVLTLNHLKIIYVLTLSIPFFFISAPLSHIRVCSHYKAINKDSTKKTSLSDERIRVLEEMGFRWSVQESLWDVSRFVKLCRGRML